VIGKTLSHYEILEPLGAGGMGEVYLAEDTRLGREVAVKVLPSELANDSDRLDLFEEEARSAAALNHPGVCTIHEVGHALDRAFIVMEYVEGQSLADSIPAGGLPPQTVARYGIQIADGLDHAHQHGIIHRDLKSANVMVTPADRLKILDFGLARRLEKTELDKTARSTAALTEFGSIGGTLPYLPPEVLRGQPADERSDIWALGVVLYEAATAELPFTGETGFELVSAILRDPSKPLPSHVPAPLGQVIERCLSKEPGRRYRSAGQVQSALEAVASGRADVRAETATEGAGEPTVTMGRPGALRIVLVGAAAVIAAFLLVGLDVGGVRQRLGRALGIMPETVANPAGELALAVLPFDNLSPDADNEYFAAGMTEELISKLSRIGDLQVTSRASVMRFKGAEVDVREIGDELGVRYVVGGSIRKAREQVRITARLVDASTGFQLWAQDFDSDLGDIFAVQEETALQIADALGLRLSPVEAETVRRRYTENPDAYDAYLRGWVLLESFHAAVDPPEDKLAAAREHFERALALEPEYAPALAGLSVMESYYYFFDVDRSPERLESATALARRAIALDPQLAEAQVALGHSLGFAGDYVAAVDRFRQALRLDPGDGYAWCYLAWACNNMDPADPEAAERAAREAIRRQPTYFWAHSQLSGALQLQGRYEEAIGALESAVQLEPDFRTGHVNLGRLYVGQREYRQALASFERARRIRETPALVVEISAVHAALGDTESSLEELEKGLAAGFRGFDAIDEEERFASLREDPRFQELLRAYRQ
jgi:non-specific serine/threonine protein kinase